MELKIYIHKSIGIILGIITPIEENPERNNFQIHRVITADKITKINGTDEADKISELLLKSDTVNQIQKLNIHETTYIEITNTYKSGPNIVTLWKLEGSVVECNVK